MTSAAARRALMPTVPAVDRQPAARGRGRPDGYTAGLADLICDRLARGESLLAICAEEGMPSQSMVYRWLEKYDLFREKYARARELQCDTLSEEAIQVARNGSAEMAAANRVRLDAIRWYTSKIAPKKYGDNQTVKHEGAVDVNMTIRTIAEPDLNREIAALLARGGVTDVEDESDGGE